MAKGEVSKYGGSDWTSNVGSMGVVRAVRLEDDGSLSYGVLGPPKCVDDDQCYYATIDMLEETMMTEKNMPVCAPMTTFTPDPTTLAHVRSAKSSSIHVTNCKCVFAGHASTPDPRCVALHDAQTLTVIGTEPELAERWRKLMKAESVLQNARDEIEALDDTSPGFAECVKKVLADQNTRPSPDFRALMVKAHAQLLEIYEAMPASAPVALVRPMKEALRLTDVERLKPWSGSAQGRAMIYVVNALIEELGDIADGSHEDIVEDRLWIEQTKLDLEEARDKPEEYLARIMMRRSRS